MINDALDSLVTAVESGRTDVIKDVIATVQKCEKNDEGIGLTLRNLFCSECCDEGTILHLAVEKKNRDAVRALLTSGAYPSCKNKDGYTAFEITNDRELRGVFNEQLLHSIAQGKLSRVEEFLDAGCDSNCVDSDRARNTPLHWAAAYSTLEVAQLLIDDGGSVNAQNSDGVTPLHDAIQRGEKKMVDLLIHNGADPSIAATEGKLAGRTALDIADERLKPSLQRLDSVELVRPTINDLNPPQQPRLPVTPHGTVPSQLADLSQLNINPHRGQQELSAANLKKRLEEVQKESLTADAKKQQSGPERSSSSPHLDGSAADAAVAAAGNSVIDSYVDDSEGEDNFSNYRELIKLLWPQPQKLVLQPERGMFKPADKVVVAAVNGPEHGVVHEILNAWRAKRQSFLDLHIEFVMETIAYQTTPAVITFDLPSIVCQLDKDVFKQSQSYKLSVLENQIRIIASDLAGLHYAVSTLIQLLEIFDSEEAFPCLQIHDWPDMNYRGVMLDCSKGRILHEANLWELVDRLSILKCNEVHLYSRFNVPQTNEDNPDIWQFPYTRSMLIEFDRFCQQRFITLIPVLDISHNVTFDKLSALYPVFLDFLSCFTYSRKINIGPRLSLMLIDINDPTAMNPKGFLPLSDNQLILCGEALKQSEDLQQALMWLPSNMTLACYGYSAEFSFSNTVKHYSDMGKSFYLCPGTSAWNSLAGCPEVALRNIYNAVQEGQQNQALGILICDWSGKGHVTDSLFSLPPLVAQAGMAWNSSIEIAATLDRLPSLIDVHMLCDQKKMIGSAILQLGNMETELLRSSKNIANGDVSYGKSTGSILYQLLSAPDTVDLTFLSPTIFQRSMRTIRHLHTQIQSAELQCYQGQEQLSALQLTLDLALTACRLGQALAASGRNPSSSGTPGTPVINVGVANLPATVKTDIANRLLSLKDAYKSCYLSRNLPNGLNDSQSLVFRSIGMLLPGKKLPSKLKP